MLALAFWDLNSMAVWTLVALASGIWAQLALAFLETAQCLVGTAGLEVDADCLGTGAVLCTADCLGSAGFVDLSTNEDISW
jgi:hypothetical protein